MPHQERIRTFGEKENYKYFGILEADTIKQAEVKEKKTRKEYLRGTRKLLETKQESRQKDKRLNCCEVCHLGGPQSENQRKQKKRQVLGPCQGT